MNTNRLVPFLAGALVLSACADQQSPTAATPERAALRSVMQQGVGLTPDTDGLQPQGPYHVFVLGPGSGAAYAINDRDQVVGDTGGRAFLWDGGVFQDLGTLGGRSSRAVQINNQGDAAGFWMSTTGDLRVFLYRNGVMQDLGSDAGGGKILLNGHGDVAWTAATSSGTRAMLFSNGAVTDLGTLGGPSANVGGLNDQGEVAGVSTLADGTAAAFVWSRGQMTALPLPPRGGVRSVMGIDRKGHVGGTAGGGAGTLEPWIKAWAFDGSTTTLIPVFSNDSMGNAVAVTPRGDVLGESMNLDFDNGHPFVWSNGTLAPLNPALTIDQWVVAVNESDVITGFEQIDGVHLHAFVIDQGVSWDLGAIDGVLGTTQRGISRGNAINKQGDVAGVSASSPALWLRQ